MNRVVKSLILDRISNRKEILRKLRKYTGGRAVDVINLIPLGQDQVTLHFRTLMEVAVRDFSLRELAVSLTAYAELYLITEDDTVFNAEDSIAVSLFPSFNSDPERGLCVDLEPPEGYSFTFETHESAEDFGCGQAIDIWCRRVGDGTRLTQLIQLFFTAYPHDTAERLCLAFRDWIKAGSEGTSQVEINFQSWNLRLRNMGGDAVLSFSHENRSVVQAVVSGLFISNTALLSYQREVVGTVEAAMVETRRILFGQ